MRSRNSYLIIPLLFIIGLVAYGMFYLQTQVQQSTAKIRYLPLGDSYTIGEGVLESERWPNVLTTHLQESGYDIELLANPAVSGFTTRDVIDYQLPVLVESEANFVTVLIGANDYFQGVSKEVYEENLQKILDEIEKKTEGVVLVTIPDYTVTPQAKQYGDGEQESKELAEFNEIIINEGKKRNIPVVDIFYLTQEMGDDPTLVVSDGLHPSAKEYKKWEEVIYPVVVDAVGNMRN